MKRIISLLICLLLVMTSMCVFADASNSNTKVYEIDGAEYEVEFEGNTLSDEKMDAIAYNLIGVEAENEAMPKGILCDIFGHDLNTKMVSVIQHKAISVSPRCRKQTFDVTYCEDCDYTVQKLLNTTYIACCPED